MRLYSQIYMAQGHQSRELRGMATYYWLQRDKVLTINHQDAERIYESDKEKWQVNQN